jgi:hypothetical protein
LNTGTFLSLRENIQNVVTAYRRQQLFSIRFGGSADETVHGSVDGRHAGVLIFSSQTIVQSVEGYHHDWDPVMSR